MRTTPRARAKSYVIIVLIFTAAGQYQHSSRPSRLVPVLPVRARRWGRARAGAIVMVVLIVRKYGSRNSKGKGGHGEGENSL